MAQVALGQLDTVTSPLRVAYADTKQGGEGLLAIGQVDLAPVVDVILADGLLSLHHLAAQLDLLARLIQYVDFVGLVATGPNDPVCLLDVDVLLLRCLGTDELHSLFRSLDNVVVKLFSVAPETREAVNKIVFLGKQGLVEGLVVVLRSFFGCLVEHSYFVSVQYFDLDVLWQVILKVKVELWGLEAAS